MNPIYSVAEIRATEQSAALQLPPGALMQRAGQAAANAALDLLPFSPSSAKVLVLAGPGNNGGDALEAAAHLAHAGIQVSVWLMRDTGAPSAERQHALERMQGSDAVLVNPISANTAPDDPELSGPARDAIASTYWSLVVDGLFGIGLKRPVDGVARALVELVNGLDCRILALDVPSGLDADTGAVVGPDGIAVRATHTVTFIGDKPGLHTCDGRDYAGTVQVSNLDIDAAHYRPARIHLNDVGHFARHLHARKQNSHKGSYGNAMVVGGAHGMTGAPILAARTALHAGAGRVYIAFPDEAPAYDSGQPELMCRLASDVDFDTATLIVGPGLGTTQRSRELLMRAIDSASAVLLDADALNLVAADPELQSSLAQRGKISVLTPHPLEAARLLGVTIEEVQADRLGAARQLAAQLHVTVVLKGSGTVIAAPDGNAVINTTGNPALATAGTGDVLSGLCGSLLAQGWPEWEAALAAVWLHGMAADVLVSDGVGPIGLAASELVPAIRVAINKMVEYQRH